MKLLDSISNFLKGILNWFTGSKSETSLTDEIKNYVQTYVRDYFESNLKTYIQTYINDLLDDHAYS